MKKDLLFTPLLILVGTMLNLLDSTGITAHIAIGVVGVLILVAYTVATKKEWKIPALEVLMRICYGLALISGVVIMNVQGIAALAIGHKVLATLFQVLLLVLFVHKLVVAKKKA